MENVPQCLSFMSEIRAIHFDALVLIRTIFYSGILFFALKSIAQKTGYKSDFVPFNSAAALMSSIAGSGMAQRFSNSLRLDCDPGQSPTIALIAVMDDPIIAGAMAAFVLALPISFAVAFLSGESDEKQHAFELIAGLAVGFVIGLFV